MECKTGAWILEDERPLPPDPQAFLDAGEPPVYVGFGSVRAPQGFTTAVIQTVRALGRRTIVGRGWAELSLIDGEPDCFRLGEVNRQALFLRVAAVVHHGGAGTTTTAAAAGTPQVIVARSFDQSYFANRVERLGIGIGLRRGGTHRPPSDPSGDSSDSTRIALHHALHEILDPDVAATAHAVASNVGADGASAAQRLTQARQTQA